MKTIYRSAKTGKIVTKEFAKDNPDTTVKETYTNVKSIVFGEGTPEEKIEILKTLLK
tara:strand:- start:43671 stop:43841 length:171 start_codon:yes stop_codon:yes gene_type:complete